MGTQALVVAVFLSCCTAATAGGGVTPISISDDVLLTTPSTFVAHGWEPWSATHWFEHFDNPVLQKTFSHLNSTVIRFGGITADWLKYVAGNAVSAPCVFGPAWGQGRVECPFSTGSFDALLSFLDKAGIRVLFDLNELIGRNCGQSKDGKHQWCGDKPAAWDTAPVQLLLAHIKDKGFGNIAGFELGNELWAPEHLPRETAIDDFAALVKMVEKVWPNKQQAPPVVGFGTNDCWRNNGSDLMAGIELSNGNGFSFHSYPAGHPVGGLVPFLTNSSWLRHNTLSEADRCLKAWNAGPRSRGLSLYVTEAAASYGITKGTPDTSSFLHGFFSIAQLGQFATAGAGLVARWSINSFLLQEPGRDPTSWIASSDFFLYQLYQNFVGHGVLEVTGDDDSALVYAHCSAGSSNGSITVFAANPSDQTIALSLKHATQPRSEFILTAPGGNFSSKTPILNGNAAQPLALNADGSLPAMPARFCGAQDSMSQSGACGDTLTLPPYSQSFFVLLSAGVKGCKN
mmetsp:Transcript_41041/g.80511  ORF Transcript_41041/g.80511 Transcript_41041/m.80511 type:complete len:515 (-) Transcript_41041:152-1696(-)